MYCSLGQLLQKLPRSLNRPLLFGRKERRSLEGGLVFRVIVLIRFDDAQDKDNKYDDQGYSKC